MVLRKRNRSRSGHSHFGEIKLAGTSALAYGCIWVCTDMALGFGQFSKATAALDTCIASGANSGNKRPGIEGKSTYIDYRPVSLKRFKAWLVYQTVGKPTGLSS